MGRIGRPVLSRGIDWTSRLQLIFAFFASFSFNVSSETECKNTVWHITFSRKRLLLHPQLNRTSANFHNTCLRKILQVYWPKTISYKTTKQENVCTVLKRRRWKWTNVFRMISDLTARTALGPRREEEQGPKTTLKHGDELWKGNWRLMGCTGHSGKERKLARSNANLMCHLRARWG